MKKVRRRTVKDRKTLSNLTLNLPCSIGERRKKGGSFQANSKEKPFRLKQTATHKLKLKLVLIVTGDKEA